MRWVATYKGGSFFNQSDGLFAIDRIRKLGYLRGNSGNWRYLAITIQPESCIIYETYLEIEDPPSDQGQLKRWKEEYTLLMKRLMLDVIAEFEKQEPASDVVDLMNRFGFSGS